MEKLNRLFDQPNTKEGTFEMGLGGCLGVHQTEK